MVENSRVLRIESPCVVQNLRRASRIVTRRYEEALRPVDLTVSQFTILQTLSRENRMPHGRMADILGFEHTTLIRLLKPLLRRGMVTIVPDPDDRRARFVSLTPAGATLLDEAEIIWSHLQAENLARMNPEEWRLVRETLSKLTR